ncbi:MAG: gfo/Idh/MocA family oxidoreductase [Planctomycetota bacterium]|nr:MAG: gfo/Idh/MocA family oxidoreductase [Planctomycetota bacterium]
MAPPITVGVLTHAGGAHVGAYLSGLATAKDCDAVYLADPDGRWQDEAKRRLGDKLKGTTRDYEQLLKEHTPAMALVTMEARLAPPVIDAALDAGCHVFAEKPACVRVADFARLVDKADSKHRYLMLALANRSKNDAVAAREIIAAGRIGKLYGIEVHIIADQTRLTDEAYHDTWYAHRKRAGGGHLIWLGIHWLDLAMFLTGSSIDQTCGFIANVGGQPIDVEDSAAAAFRFDNGALGTITSGYYLDQSYHSHIKIWGSAGWIHLEPMLDRPLRFYENAHASAGVQTWPGSRDPRGYEPFVHEAVRACATMSDPPITSAESLRALRTVFAIYASAESGKTTKV